MIASDWIKLISLPIILVNIGVILWLMRVVWFRPVGWVTLMWMLTAFLFNGAVLVDKLIIDWLSPVLVNMLSISLHLTGYVCVTLILIILLYVVASERRGIQ